MKKKVSGIFRFFEFPAGLYVVLLLMSPQPHQLERELAEGGGDYDGQGDQAVVQFGTRPLFCFAVFDPVGLPRGVLLDPQEDVPPSALLSKIEQSHKYCDLCGK